MKDKIAEWVAGLNKLDGDEIKLTYTPRGSEIAKYIYVYNYFF